jgi:hypothetical protein
MVFVICTNETALNLLEGHELDGALQTTISKRTQNCTNNEDRRQDRQSAWAERGTSHCGIFKFDKILVQPHQGLHSVCQAIRSQIHKVTNKLAYMTNHPQGYCASQSGSNPAC